MTKTIGEAEFNAQKLRIDELLELVQALTKRVLDLETMNNAQAEKIAIVESEQKKGQAADVLWSTITKNRIKKNPEQLKVINVMADESKERNKKEKM